MKPVATAATAAVLIAVLSHSGALRAQPISQPAAKVNVKQLAAQVAALQATVSSLQTTVTSLQNQLSSQKAQNAFALGQFVTVDTQHEVNGVLPPHVIITGANLHVRSGSGTTIDDTHLGNLLIGYDSDSGNDAEGPCVFHGTSAFIDSQRGGSHNLIIGDCHGFTSSGGFIAGFDNQMLNNSASVSGGWFNQASGIGSSVSGGDLNVASVIFSSVSGGLGNRASGTQSSVSGGKLNEASGDGASSVSGGLGNRAFGTQSSVSGGSNNTASGDFSSVGGGDRQTAAGAQQNIN
jgi:hypothetical protein